MSFGIGVTGFAKLANSFFYVSRAGENGEARREIDQDIQGQGPSVLRPEIEEHPDDGAELEKGADLAGTNRSHFRRCRRRA